MNLYEKNGNILYILNVLKRYSDENHLLSIKEIKEKINEIYEVDIDPRTIRRNINLLKEKFSIDISTYNENNIGYYLLKDPDTDFEPGEIRAIIDQFSYANYIPDKISKQIINKCRNMQTVYENEKLKNYQIISNDTKTDNMEVIKNIEDISDSIYENKKIKFTYYKYELTNTLNKTNVKEVICSPIKVLYALQQFYLICIKDKEKEFRTYRIDRIKNIKKLNIDVENYNSKKLSEYIKTSISMFGGEVDKIEFISNIELLDMVVEQFGKDIKLKRIDNNKFSTEVLASINGFKFFALRNLENIRVIKPISLRKQIDKIINNYKND